MSGGICYVSFSGNMDRTACGVRPDLDRVSIFLSGTTCRGCLQAIQDVLEPSLRPPDGRKQSSVAGLV